MVPVQKKLTELEAELENAHGYISAQRRKIDSIQSETEEKLELK